MAGRKFVSAIVADGGNERTEKIPGNMLKDAEFLRLWDVYNPLLTPRQREITDLYFNYDLSLAEIAENNGVSRQSVSDCLAKCRKQLDEYEEKLGFVGALDELSAQFSAYMTDVERWLCVQREKRPDLAEEIDRLKETLEADGGERGVRTFAPKD